MVDCAPARPFDKEKDKCRIEKFINKHHAVIFKMKREIKCYNLSLNKCSLRPECLAVVKFHSPPTLFKNLAATIYF